VLGGALSPIEGIDPEDLRIAELERRVASDHVVEVVVATNPTMSGEATASYLADLLRGRAKVTRLASGLPVGVDLEHTDELTLSKAFSGRREPGVGPRASHPSRHPSRAARAHARASTQIAHHFSGPSNASRL